MEALMHAYNTANHSPFRGIISRFSNYAESAKPLPVTQIGNSAISARHIYIYILETDRQRHRQTDRYYAQI